MKPAKLAAKVDVKARAQEYRDQERNRQACEEKLAEMVRVALVEPTPRKKVKPSKAAKKRRGAS